MRVRGVSHASKSSACGVRACGSRIIGGGTNVQNRLSGLADEEIQQRAARAIAGLPAFLERLSALFSGIGPVPTPEELVLLERNPDEWLDYRTALILFPEAIRQRVTENSADNFPEPEALHRQPSGWLAQAVAQRGRQGGG